MVVHLSGFANIDLDKLWFDMDVFLDYLFLIYSGIGFGSGFKNDIGPGFGYSFTLGLVKR